MAVENATLPVDGKNVPLGNIPGFTFDQNDHKFVKIDDLVKKGLNKLQPLETNQTKHLQADVADGSWAYPGTENGDMGGGMKFMIALIIILVVVGVPSLYFYKRKTSERALLMQQQQSQANRQQQQQQQQQQSAEIDPEVANTLEKAL